MPVTPLHLLPALALYFLFFRRLNLFAFFSATLLIDIEPMLYLLFDVPIPQIPLISGGYTPVGLHIITHNPFGIVLLVAPSMTILAKTLERMKSFWLTIIKNASWVDYSLRSVYLSALLGAFLHLGWDMTMHYDINLAFPLYYMPNPFVNHQVLDMVWNISLITAPVAFVLSIRRYREHPFNKIP